MLGALALYKVQKALLAALGSPTASFRWLSFLWSNQFAQLRLHCNPGFVVKPFRRYLNLDYKFPDRVRSLVSHYEFAVERFSSEQLESIYFGAGLILAEFHGKSGVFYRVVLGTHRACHNEGEMLLKIETSKCDVVCFAIFTIGSSKNGKLQIELGTIQGQSKNTDFSVTVLATRDFHGLRPKHLLMAIVYSVARNWKIDTILCVANRTHPNGTNPLFYSNYDTLWEQLGGQLTGMGFYLLPLHFSYPTGINQGRKHRSRHRRRTELKNKIFKMVKNSLTSALTWFVSLQDWNQIAC